MLILCMRSTKVLNFEKNILKLSISDVRLYVRPSTRPTSYVIKQTKKKRVKYFIDWINLCNWTHVKIVIRK